MNKTIDYIYEERKCLYKYKIQAYNSFSFEQKILIDLYYPYIADEIREEEKEKEKEREELINIKNKKAYITNNNLRKKNRDKRIYYSRCRKITENNKNNIKDIEKREFKRYDIDHIVPISYGYKNNIPPELIGSIDNLRIIDNKINFQKCAKLIDESYILLKKWEYFTKKQ